MIRTFVPGIPKPQGSKRHVGGGRMIESCKALPAWRSSVSAALRPWGSCVARETAVNVDLIFVMPRPKASKKAEYPVKRPDIDKMIRAILDAATMADVWADDSQVVSVSASKIFEDNDTPPGVWIEIQQLAVRRAA